MRRSVGFAGAVLLVVLVTPAAANVPESFTACGSDTKDGECTKLVDVAYGETVFLKGKVKPPHADLDAGLWHKGPFEDSWEKWATVQITDRGVMKYTWETTFEDGAQDTPHRFQFRIPDHGNSNRVRVRVWLGE